MNKKMLVALVLLVLSPLLFFKVFSQNLDSLFTDRRQAYRATDLMTLGGKNARKHVDAPLVQRTIRYQIKWGDTWTGIASEHGVSKIDELILYNRNKKLIAGAFIKIPPYLVKQQ